MTRHRSTAFDAVRKSSGFSAGRALVAATAMIVFGSAAPALAQDSGDVVYRKHTVVDFGDDTIEGDLSKPDGAYLDSQKRQRHARLIKVRENFKPEILQSVTTL